MPTSAQRSKRDRAFDPAMAEAGSVQSWRGPSRRRCMLFHTMVGSNDIDRAKRFYDTVLGTLGVGEATINVADSGHTRLIYNSGNGANFIVTQPINDEPASVANGSTVAFSCDSPEQVKQFHDVAVANGGTSIEVAPGPRETASMGTIVLAYFRDPDGNKLCGIHFPK